MKSIAQHIEYLLTVHDCVVVPGLGSFVTNDESARYDELNETYLPPVRSLAFNPEVRHNDAMLVSSISRADCISQEAARKQMEIEVSSINYQLKMSGEVSLGGLGMLKCGENSDFPVFEPYDDSLPMRIYEGLEPLNIKTLSSALEYAALEEEEGIKPAVEKEIAVAKEPRIIPLPLKIVASIAVILVILGVIYSTTSLVKSPELNYASLDTGFSSDAFPASVDNEPEISVSREIVLNIAEPNSPDAKGVAKIQGKHHVANNDPYLLIVASFKSRKLAQKHIAISGNHNMCIVEMDGNFRVYVAGAPTRNQAAKLAGKLSSHYPDVWVCRR